MRVSLWVELFLLLVLTAVMLVSTIWGCGGLASGTPYEPDAGKLPIDATTEVGDQGSLDQRLEGQAKALQPQFSIPSGVYEGQQTLQLSTSTVGAKIVYTTDGSTPVAGSSPYSQPLLLLEGTNTVKAMTIAEGWIDSDVATGVFTIKAAPAQQAAAPVFEPPSGAACSLSLDISITSTTPGVQIHYTTDGTNPDGSAPTYNSPVTVSGMTTLKAIALDPTATYLDSLTSIAGYSCLTQAAAPSYSPPAGKYKGSQDVVLSSSTGGAEIRYTTDGTEPTGASTMYVGAVKLESTTTLRAIATADGYLPSNVTTATYEIEPLAMAAMPTFSPPPGTYGGCSLDVALSTTTPQAEIRYTLDTTDPSETSTLYKGAIPLLFITTIKARAFAPGYAPSLIATGHYDYGGCQTATLPTLSPPGGIHCDSVQVALATKQPGMSTIVYTLDGTVPSETNGVMYTGPFVLTATTTVKATTVAFGYCTCTWNTELFTIVSCPDE